MGKLYLIYHNESWYEYSQPHYVLNPSGYAKFIAKFEECVVKPSRESIFGFVHELVDENVWYKKDISFSLMQMLLKLSAKPSCIIKKDYFVIECINADIIHSIMQLESPLASWIDAERFLKAFKEIYPVGYDLYFVKLENENRLHPIITCPSEYSDVLRIINRSHKYYDIMIDFYNQTSNEVPDFVIIEPTCVEDMLKFVASRACALITPESQYRIFEYEMDKNGILLTENYDPIGLQRKD